MKMNGIEITAHTDGSITKPFRGRTKRMFGSIAEGYRKVNVGGKTYRVHRLIAKAHLPDYSEDLQVDHIDGQKANNDISNLRMATNAGNQRAHISKLEGCSSQYRGVCWDKRSKKWLANCKIDYKARHIGYFDDERDAAIARDTYVFSQGFPLEGLNFPEHFDACLGI
jgi:hypothetical protein|tara:strand:+ start:229 stop:732 length:504 start_codon:yes stop_codon:yes gene_type:complete